MKKSIKKTTQEIVNNIFLYRDLEFINKSLNSFGLKTKEELASEFKKIVMRHNANIKGKNFNYFAQYLTENQMGVFTTFETHLRGLMNCSQQRDAVTTFYGFTV